MPFNSGHESEQELVPFHFHFHISQFKHMRSFITSPAYVFRIKCVLYSWHYCVIVCLFQSSFISKVVFMQQLTYFIHFTCGVRGAATLKNKGGSRDFLGRPMFQDLGDSSAKLY